VVQQPGFAAVEQWFADDREIVIWTLTPVEILSALQRLLRGGQLTEGEAIQADSVLFEFSRRFHRIVDVERVKTIAYRVLRVHNLRAADALQLAAAIAWADGYPPGLFLHTFDRQLATAALREGFVSPSVSGGK
jgi:predicted nucleic acid-binding protein